MNTPPIAYIVFNRPHHTQRTFSAIRAQRPEKLFVIADGPRGGGFTKRIMRDALRDILPEAIRYRRDKIGWNAPVHEWLRGPLKYRVEALLRATDKDSAEPHEWLGDRDLTQDVAAQFASFQAAPSPTYKDGEALWCALLPAFWRHSLKLADKNWLRNEPRNACPLDRLASAAHHQAGN
jgi:hypothetical protein